MAKKRKKDPTPGLWFRTDRLFEENGKWYFHTRERTIEGPFDDRLDAQCMLETYINVENGGLLPEDNALTLEPLNMDKVS